MRRRIVRPTVVLPQPDSPTRPSVLPGCRSKLTPSTAFTCPTVFCNSPRRIGKYVRRSRTFSNSPFCDVEPGAAEPLAGELEVLDSIDWLTWPPPGRLGADAKGGRSSRAL